MCDVAIRGSSLELLPVTLGILGPGRAGRNGGYAPVALPPPCRIALLRLARCPVRAAPPKGRAMLDSLRNIP